MSTHPPAFSDGLPPSTVPAQEPTIPFLKLLPTQRQTVLVLSETWCGGITHYAGGRMKLHSADGCPYCENGQTPRWYAWLHVLAPRTIRQFIVQLATSQHGVLFLHHQTHGTLRGSCAVLERRGKSANTPTSITFTAPPDPAPHLPDAADLATILARRMEWTAGTGNAQKHSSTPEGAKTKEKP